MKNIIVKKSKVDRKGVFARKNIKKGEVIIIWHPKKIVTKTKLKKLSEDEQNHTTPTGDGRYIVMGVPERYVNHSCNPNCYIKMKTIAIKDVYALRDIQEGEELTSDYTLTSVDQFAGMGFWEGDCKCGSKNCRGILTGDFFTLSKEIQLKFYRNLPPSTIRKYNDRFKKL